MSGTLHICAPAMTERSRKPVGDKWCFRCRKRLPHEEVVLAPTEQPSYWDPIWKLECSRCHQDHTAFPGTVY